MKHRSKNMGEKRTESETLIHTIHYIFISGKLSSISSLTEKYSSHSLRLWKRLCAVFCIFALLPISNIQQDPACCAHFCKGVSQSSTKTEQPLVSARKTRHHPSTKLSDPSKKIFYDFCHKVYLLITNKKQNIHEFKPDHQEKPHIFQTMIDISVFTDQLSTAVQILPVAIYIMNRT